MKKVGQYSFYYRGGSWRICRITQVLPNGAVSTVGDPDQPTFHTREEARRHIYRLNGWTYRQ